jgi:glycosyltransferase involved in cell wall biosynthesis
MHVVSWYGAMSETFLYQAITQLADRGWDTWLGTRSVENRAVFPFPPDDRIVLAAPDRRRRPLRSLIRGQFDQVGVRWPASAAAVHPDVIHAHFGWSALDALTHPALPDAPLVATFHGSDATVYPFGRRRYRPLAGLLRVGHAYRDLTARLSATIAVSRHVESALRRLGFEQQIDVVPAGVALEDFPYRGALLPEEGPRLLFVGRQFRVKGLDVLLRALPAIRARHPQTRLEVIGYGSEQAHNEDVARQLGLDGAVTFHGGLPSSEVRAALREAHILVLPSRTMPDGQAEGSPVVTKEAFATGLQVVGTRCGGIPETFPPELRDELVAEEDHAALARRVLDLLAHPEDWSERAELGRRWVEREFDWKVLAARTEGVYLRALGETATQPEAPSTA